MSSPHEADVSVQSTPRPQDSTLSTPSRESVPSQTTRQERACEEQRQSQLRDVLDTVRRAVRADGGDMHLIDACYDTGVITVQLSGACSACAVASITLEEGVARILRQRLDWVTEVRHSVADSVDIVADRERGRGGFVPR